MLKGWPLELIIWVSGLLFLAFTANAQSHSGLCPLDNLGFSWCPGCGLGRSIRSILHGDVSASFEQHWFGLPALVILIFRILALFRIFMVNLFQSKPELS